MKQIVFVTQTLGMGGAEVFNLELLTWLQKHDCQVQAYTNFDKFRTLLPNSHKIPLVIDIIGDWKGLLKGIALMPLGFIYYGALVLTHPGQTFVMTGFIEKILLSPWAKITGSRIVWIEFGPLETVLTKFGGIPGMVYKMVAGLPDVVIMSSEHTKKANAHLFNKSIQVIPCAITPQKTNAKTDPQLVTCVSRLEPGKGQDKLIEAWREVVRQVPTAKLRIVGEGDQLESLKSQVSRLKLTKSIEIVGWVPSAVAEIAKAGVVVFPSTWPLEGFGIVAIEAMSQAKPVVGFARGPLPEIIDAKSGILVAPGDVSQLAQAITNLLTHPQLAQKMGEAGKKRFQKLFTWDSVGPQFLHWL